MRDLLEKKFFPFVIKPGRYTGGEPGQIVKEADGRFKYLHAYPDRYEIGQLHLDSQIIYHIINSDQRFLCERVFAVDRDAEELMRRESIPLFSLESSRPAGEFDAIGFSLTRDLVQTNILAMLDLASIPLLSIERSDDDPIILGGGPTACNPEPLAEFCDIFCVGDAEAYLPHLLALLKDLQGKSRAKKLEAVCRQLAFAYVPRFYDDSARPTTDFAPEKINASVVAELKPEIYSDQPIVPLVDVVHNHLAVEIKRNRPVRIRPQHEVLNQIDKQIASTGYDMVRLMSESDYPDLELLSVTAAKRLNAQRVSLSLPSLRPGTVRSALLASVGQVRKGSLSIAPDAGSERLRLFIGKEFPNEAVYDTVRVAFSSGWSSIKLNFMIGLPTETEQDLMAIADMIREARRISRQYDSKSNITVTLSPFTPQPHTPFQWDEMPGIDEFERRLSLVKQHCRVRQIAFRTERIRSALVSGIISRGDRNLGRVILQAYISGCRFDSWKEEFDWDKWQAAFKHCHLDIDDCCKSIPFGSHLPWSHIINGASEETLQEKRKRTSQKLAEFTPKYQGSAKSTGDSSPAIEYGRSRKKAPSRNAVAPTKNCVRIMWGKDTRLRHLSHLDHIRIIERSIRRARVPVAYSQGIHPKMKISLGPPLTLGFTSESELVDITLETNLEPYMIDELKKVLPPGIEILDAKIVFGKPKSLSAAINRVVYTVRTGELSSIVKTGHTIDDLMRASSLQVIRKGKQGETEIDIRPAIYELDDKDGTLTMTLGVGESGYAKPTEVIDFLYPDIGEAVKTCAIHRREMFRQETDGRITHAMDL